MFRADDVKVYVPDCALELESGCISDLSNTSETLTIVTPAGSKAEEYAKANGIKVEND